MTLGQLVRLGMFLRRQVEPSLHESVSYKIIDPWVQNLKNEKFTEGKKYLPVEDER